MKHMTNHLIINFFILKTLPEGGPLKLRKQTGGVLVAVQ